jgi:hypothetical protein
VFIIISDIGIDKMEAHLVSIKDSLDRDLMLVGVPLPFVVAGPPFLWIVGYHCAPHACSSLRIMCKVRRTQEMRGLGWACFFPLYIGLIP